VPTLDSRAPVSEAVLLISDIHGRIDALDAVLEEARGYGVKRTFVAGDLLNGGPDPLGVWRRLSEIKAQCVRGVSDSALCTVDASKLVPLNEIERQKLDSFLWTRRTVGELVLESLRRLPLTLRVPLIDGGELVITHGSPADPFQEITQDMDDDEILALIADDPADVVVCGASHVSFQRTVEGVHVVNVGSVGSAPEGRVAHYTIFTPTPGLRTIEQNAVEY
jgi:predicted phosphodiesterase